MDEASWRPERIATGRAGVGLKPMHVSEILETRADIGFFEVHAENYMGAGGPPHAQLEAIRERYPVSLHGVGLSIGGAGPLDADHLARLKALDRRYRPALFSEHLAWSTHDGTFLNDLLPVPYTDEALNRIVDHIDEVQSAMGRQMLLENPSTYVVFTESTMGEAEFIARIAARSGCGLLLDINNVFVSATNHAYSPEAYLDAFPLDLVQEIHLGGHAATVDEAGAALLIDSHDASVADPVWTLYERTIRRLDPVPTLIEWDADVPSWTVLAAEAARADAAMARAWPATPASVRAA
ncbi:MAG TPA: DUF692 domain-containing protein [Lichenihabitans sp.]|jgi:hypothetical protein|nr:DUF692 domain-containing protein [Lichenihabitans sp.]